MRGGLLTRFEQIEVVEDGSGAMDPQANFRLILLQTELERFKFLIRSLLRTRMAKVTSVYAILSVHLASDMV